MYPACDLPRPNVASRHIAIVGQRTLERLACVQIDHPPHSMRAHDSKCASRDRSDGGSSTGRWREETPCAAAGQMSFSSVLPLSRAGRLRAQDEGFIIISVTAAAGMACVASLSSQSIHGRWRCSLATGEMWASGAAALPKIFLPTLSTLVRRWTTQRGTRGA